MDQRILKRRIVMRRIIQAIILVSIFLMAITRLNQENDFFWQYRMGEEIIKNHHFPIRDTYSFTSYGEVWTLEEWVPSVIFYLIFNQFGSAGLILLKAAVISTTFLIFMVLFNRMKVNLYLSFLILVPATLVNTRGVWGVFPSIFEYLFIVTAIFLLEYYKETKKRWIPILLSLFSLLWAQSHGSFFLLTGLISAYLLGDILTSFIKKKWKNYQPVGNTFNFKERKYLFFALASSILAPFLTPNGYWTFLYPFRITFGKFTSYVSEYQKFWVVWQWNWSDFVHGFTLVLIFLVIFTFIISRKRLHMTDFIMAAFFMILALTAVRHVAIFALVALFVLARYISVYFGEYRGVFRRTLIKDVVLLLLIISFVFYYKTKIAKFSLGFSEDGYPKQAAELIMQNNVSGNMYNHYNYGGYLIWKMPMYKVFIDGRLEMYQGQIGEDYTKILYAEEGYKQLLEKYNINFLLIYISDPVVASLIDDPQWTYVYNDAQYVVFVKNEVRNKNVLEKYYSEEQNELFKADYHLTVKRKKALNDIKQGLQYVKKKNYLRALYYFQQAEITDPGFIDARINVAETLMKLGILSEAERELKEVLEMDPQNEIAPNYLSQIEVAKKRQKLNER